MESIAKAYEVTSSRGAPTEQTSKQPIECLKKILSILRLIDIGFPYKEKKNSGVKYAQHKNHIIQ